MDRQFHCENEGRRQLVRKLKTFNGIDYLEVAAADQKTLEVVFLLNLPGQPGAVPGSPAPALTKENIAIEGGVRVQKIQVEAASASKHILTVTVDQPGDFSTYTLRLVASSGTREPPPGFDPQLSALDFSFKAGCPAEFDCEATTACPPKVNTEPVIDYLAKDYSSFRRLMLDRLSVLMPGWAETNPADAHVALVELLAYVGDHLSYYQDAVATEAYLGTAQKRISVRRHARLLDYSVHDGCNARAWVHFQVDAGSSAEGYELPKGTVLLTRGFDEREVVVDPGALDETLNKESPSVFETMHALKLNSAHNQISFYTWSDSECCLAGGSTRATLSNENGLSLEAGDVLIFEEIRSPTSGLAAETNPNYRHAVRLTKVISQYGQGTPLTDPLTGALIVEIEWHTEDALPFPLCLSARVIGSDGEPDIIETSVARGNVVLADHGLTTTAETLEPETVPESGNYRPSLERRNVTFGVAYDDGTARAKSALSALTQAPEAALPSVLLEDADETWEVQRDLLSSDRFDAHFVVEVEKDSTAFLRFGDDEFGKKPMAGTEFKLTYRTGNGSAGNVGAEAISRMALSLKGIRQVRNPLAATGGADAESIEEVRQFAPQAFRVQQRAVTEADYAEVAQGHPEVQKAAATFRWTGSWHTVFVTIDRKGGLEMDDEFEAEMRRHLEQFRLAGYDLEVKGPVYVPLEIALLVCVQTGYFQSDVKTLLLEVFSNRVLSDGTLGFFHADNFTFGQPLYLSQIFQKAMAVAGVVSVEAIKFKRWGELPNQERENGYVLPASLEIVRLDNDPNFPENGKMEFKMQGGL